VTTINLPVEIPDEILRDWEPVAVRLPKVDEFYLTNGSLVVVPATHDFETFRYLILRPKSHPEYTP